jgi:membrane protein implicated in regulation of membrane protease activity
VKPHNRIAVSLLAAAAMIFLCGFVSWWSHPATWLPEGRLFFVLLVAASAALGFFATGPTR